MMIFKSKKFWMAIAGVVAVLMSHFFGVEESKVLEIVALIISFILGQGLADFGKEAKK